MPKPIPDSVWLGGLLPQQYPGGLGFPGEFRPFHVLQTHEQGHREVLHDLHPDLQKFPKDQPPERRGRNPDFARGVGVL